MLKKNQNQKSRDLLNGVNNKPTDHRKWKKLLRFCADCIRCEKMIKPTHSSMTTSVDGAARRSRRKYINSMGLVK